MELKVYDESLWRSEPSRRSLKKNSSVGGGSSIGFGLDFCRVRWWRRSFDGLRMWFRRSFGGLSFDFRVIRFVRLLRVDDVFDGLGNYVVVFRCREPDVDMHGEREEL